MALYDTQNLFARILRGEIPSQKAYEDVHAFAFHDISPKAPIHVLIIPKGPYVTAFDFYANAPESLVVGFSRALAHVIDLLGIREKGFRLIANAGLEGGQEIPHFHMHILAGRPLGSMLEAL